MTVQDNQRLGHILDAIALIRELDSVRDVKTRMAIERALEIIGEAANHVSEGVKLANPDVAWREIISYRNKLIHGYFGTDETVLWEIVDIHLGELETQITSILNITSGGH